jgi:hypothetical protein
MTSIKYQIVLCGLITMGLTIQSEAQTPFYSVNGMGGTGGGTAGVSIAPGTAPSGSTALTDLGATTQFSFGTGVNGAAGESIMSSASGQPGAGILAGTLGASSSLSAFTVTLWVNLANTAALNNYRLLEISSGSPATTGTADGSSLFVGLNAGGGIQYYVNNVNGNTVGTSIASANTWNGGAIAQNTWYFIAITYDTVGAASYLYTGTQGNAASLAYTYNNLAGNLDLSSATSIALLDRFSGGRNWPGAVDDVNLYSGALNLSQINAIQAAQVSPVPEPSTFALAGLGGIATLVTFRRRRRN